MYLKNQEKNPFKKLTIACVQNTLGLPFEKKTSDRTSKI
jgi:hypothetical protein